MRIPAPRLIARHALAVGLATAAVSATFATVGAAPAGAAKPGATTTTAAGSGPELLSINAAAAAQPTATGRTITDLQFFDGRIYAGYGDYSANTGPVQITSTDPVTGTVVDEHLQDTEAVYNHRVLGGKLYTPSIDPRVGADFASSGPWQSTDAVDAVHVFDMNALTGTDLWMVGARGAQAVAWRSLDGGATWAESLAIDPIVGGDFARFYFAGVLGGKLYVQAFDGATGAQATSMVFDGSAWSAGPAIITGWYPGWRPVEFAGKLVFHGSGHARTAPISTFDGVAVRQIGTGYDVEVDGSNLYLLGADGSVKRTRDLRKWSNVGSAPAVARSIAVSGGSVVVGTTDSSIWTL